MVLVGKWLRLLALLFMIVFCSAAPEDWANINKYLGQIQFAGMAPVSFNVENMSDSIKDIIIHIKPLPPERLGDLVPAGEITIANLTCGEITISDFTLDSTADANATSVYVDLNIKSLRLACHGNLKYPDMKLLFIPIPSGSMPFSLLLPKNAEDGINANVKLMFSTPNLEVSPPDIVSVADCSLHIPSTALKLGTSWFANLLIELFMGTIQEVACQLVKGLAWVDDKTDQPGLLNKMLHQLEQDIVNISKTPPSDPAAAEKRAVVELGDVVVKEAVELNHSLPLELVSVFLNDVLGSSGEPPHQDMPVINEVVDLITSPNYGAAKVPLDLVFDVTTALSAGNMTLRSISLSALDTISNFSLLDNPARAYNYTLVNKISLKRLEAKINASVQLLPGRFVVSGGSLQPLDMDFSVKLTLLTPSVKAASLLLINGSALSHMVLGQIVPRNLSDKRALDCLAQCVLLLNFTDLDVSLGNFEASLSGFLDPGFDTLMSHAVETVMLLFKPSIHSNIPGLSRGVLRALINKKLLYFLRAEHTCPKFEADEPMTMSLSPISSTLDKGFKKMQPSSYLNSAPFVDFNSSALISVRQLLDRTIFNVTDPDVGMNRVIRVMTESFGFASGSISASHVASTKVDLEQLSRGSLQGEITAGVNNISVKGLDSFGSLKLLQPVTGSLEHPSYTTESELLLGSLPPTLTLVTQLFINVTAFGVQIYDNLELEIAIKDLFLSLQILIKMDTSPAMYMTLGKLFKIVCIESLMHTVSPVKFDVGLDRMNITLTCVSNQSCTSPALPALSKAMESTAGRTKVLELVNKATEWISHLLDKPDAQDYLHSIINDTLASAPAECAAPPTPVPAPKQTGSDTSETFKIILFSTLTAATAFQIGMGFFLHNFNSKKLRRLEESGDCLGVTQTITGPSLFRSPAVPRWMQWGVPLVALVDAALFISGHLGIGASVDVYINLLGDQIIVNDTFEFTLAGSVSDMLAAGVYPLALLIGVFSGVWPYAKLYIITWCWFVPPIVLSPKRRGQVLTALDQLGKWSLIDMYVLMLMMVSFRMHISPPHDWECFLPLKTIAVDVVVTPRWGIYGFIVAATTALALNNAVIVCHRNARVLADAKTQELKINCTNEMSVGDSNKVRASKRRRDSSWFNDGTKDIPLVNRTRAETIQLAERREALKAHEFSVPRQRTYKLRIAPLGQVTGLVIIAAGAACTLVGALIPTFMFRFYGIADLVLPEQSSYSIVSVATQMGQQGPFEGQSKFGLFFMQLVYMLFVLVIPLVQMVLLAVLWAVPLKLREQKILFFTNEVLSSWSSLEVFMVAVLGALLEISQYAAFLVGDVCDPFDSLIGIVMGSSKNATCFDVAASLKLGCSVLVVAGVMNNIACQLVVRCAESAIEDRVREVFRKSDDDVAEEELIETEWSCGECGVRCMSIMNRDQSRAHAILARLRFVDIHYTRGRDSSLVLLPAPSGIMRTDTAKTIWSKVFGSKDQENLSDLTALKCKENSCYVEQRDAD